MSSKDFPTSSTANEMDDESYLDIKSPNKFLNYAIRGFLILIPVTALFYLFRKFYNDINAMVAQIIENTPLNNHLQVFIVAIFSVTILVLIAYLIGWISSFRVVKKYTDRLDKFLMLNVPIYKKFKSKIDNTAQFGLEEKPTVFVKFGNLLRPGFLMEGPDENGRNVVFIPKNFSNYDGFIYIVPKEEMYYAEMNKNDFIFSMDHLGSGMNLEMTKA